MFSIHDAETDAQVAACHPVMVQLRPHVTEEELVRRVRRMRETGYRLVYLAEDGVVRAVAGFRLLDQLVRGLVLYVDDLVTDAAARSRGHGDALLGWLHEQARAAGCAALELDSATHREGAHRFYFRHRLTISAFHFVRAC